MSKTVTIAAKKRALVKELIPVSHWLMNDDIGKKLSFYTSDTMRKAS